MQKQSQMKILRRILLSIVTLSGIFSLSSCKEKAKYVEFNGFAQGGTYSVKINLIGKNGRLSYSPQEIKAGIDSVLTLIDTTISGYNKGSMISRFNSGEVITPNQLFIDIYEKSYSFWEETKGAIDCAYAPLFNIWGFGYTRDSLPDDTKIQEVLKHYGTGLLKKDIKSAIDADGRLDPHNLTTDKSVPVLNYNAIAQGYSCDLVAAYLYRLGVKDMLVDIGEIYCDGMNPSGKPWTIAIDKPFDGNEAPGEYISEVLDSKGRPCGIVTSGNYRKFYIKDGKKYAHTIDPRTGYPVQHNLLSATIIAHDGCSADTYASYCMVLGLEEAKEFILSREDLQGYLIYDEDGKMKIWNSLNANQ